MNGWEIIGWLTVLGLSIYLLYCQVVRDLHEQASSPPFQQPEHKFDTTPLKKPLAELRQSHFQRVPLTGMSISKREQQLEDARERIRGLNFFH